MQDSQTYDLQELLIPGGHWPRKITTTAVRLGLFAYLHETVQDHEAAQEGDAAQDATRIAGHYRGDPRSFEVFLNALTSLGILTKAGGSFSNTAFTAQYLVPTSQQYRGDQLIVDDLCWDMWGQLEETLMRGTPRVADTIFEADADMTRHLLLGLHQDALAIAPEVAVALPLDDRTRLLDVGGGAGTFSLCFCQRHRRLRATIFDLPLAAEIARSFVERWGLEDRIEVVVGDAFAGPLPPGHDAIFLSNVLHGHGEAANRRLLAHAAAALPPGGLLVVRDIFMHEGLTEPTMGAVFSVNMLLHTTEGRCYSFQEVAGWLESAGFTGVEHLQEHSIVTARQA